MTRWIHHLHLHPHLSIHTQATPCPNPRSYTIHLYPYWSSTSSSTSTCIYTYAADTLHTQPTPIHISIIYIYIHVYPYIDIHIYLHIHDLKSTSTLLPYGVAKISRMLKNIGLFCKRALQKRPIFCKETYIFKHPTNRSHPISIYVSTTAPNYIPIIYIYIHIYLYIHHLHLQHHLLPYLSMHRHQHLSMYTST